MSLIPDNYNGIVSAVKAVAEDDSVEFEAYIPTAIYLAEERLLKEIDTLGITFEASATLTANSKVLTKPTGYRYPYDTFIRTSVGSTVLLKKENDYLRDYWPVETSTSAYTNEVPKYYADRSNTAFTVAPIPASAYNVTFIYAKQIEHLSASAQTNYYTEFCPDALYYGTMCGMAEFMKDPAMLDKWEKRYVESVQTFNNEGRRARRDDGTVPNSSKVTNTLKGDN